MSESSLRNTMTVMVITILFVVATVIVVDYMYGIAPISLFSKFLIVAGLLGAVVLVCNFPYISLRCRVAMIIVLPILALELHMVRTEKVGTLSISLMVILAICSISRDTVMLLWIGLFINVIFIGNILFTGLLTTAGSTVVYNTVIFQVGMAVLYFLTRWSNEQVEAISKKTREAELAASAKSEFLANMSHEIRTPMNAVIGFTTFLKRQELPPDSRGHVLGIGAAAQTLLSLINDVLDFSKIDSGKHEIVPVTYELASLINDTISTTYVRLENKPIRLLVSVDPNIPSYLVGDDVRIRQIMTNFLVNAVKYTSRGFVKLSVKGIHSNGRILLCVSIKDSGQGIREEDKPNLFRVFQKFDSRQNRSIEGTGLGLPLSRRLLEAMDGAVYVESVYGEGSSFMFMLPQDVPGAPAKPEPFVNLKIDPETKVIVCESNREEMDSWSKTLDSLGVDHMIVTNFSEFTFLLHSAPQHRYFLDYELYKRYRASLTTSKAAITVIIDRNETIGASMNCRVLRRPVYSLPLSVALGEPDLALPSRESEGEYDQFIAPRARILVVDDSPVNLTIFAGLLRPYQCDVEQADSGREALELLKLNFFDLVFMDHMMPELDGLETTKIIRSLEGGRLLGHNEGSPRKYIQVEDSYYSDLPIIVATANAISGMREEYLKGDFDDYITKPINPSNLNTILMKWIPQDKQEPYSERVEPPAKVPSPPEVREGLTALNLPFLDTESGLRYTGGYFEGYLGVLKAFLDRSSISRELCREAQNEQRWADLRIEVHSVKSLAKGIGAEQLSALAADLESAAKRDDAVFVRDHLEDYFKTFQLVENDIKTVLDTFYHTLTTKSPFEKKEEITTEELRKRLSSVIEALEGYDFTEAIKTFDNISFNGLDKETRELFEEIRREIDRFEYEKAGNNIREYLEQS